MTTTSTVPSSAGTTRPVLVGIQHVGLTVTDIDASEAWYGRVMGLNRLFVEPHHGGDGSGYAVVLGAEGVPLFVGLDKHAGASESSFDPTVTGLDHVCFQIGSEPELVAWIAHLDSEEVDHSGVTEVEAMGMRFGVVNFRDPDGIALELIAVL